MRVFQSPDRVLLVSVVFAISVTAHAGDDWPMWRSDAGHTAASTNQIPEQLSLAWSRNFGRRNQVWDDPLNHDMMSYDRIVEPIVKDGRMFIGFNDTDQLQAFDLKSGKHLWTFFADGPVRFSPVAWKDKVFLTSDDGYLYCLNAADGSLEWKRLGGPSHQKVLGNERIIGAWPARGGPVVADDTVYFAASIWPFMGTFIYALDAHTGDVIWVNDATSADYIKQPHSAPSFAGVGPQGTLVVSDNNLIVPGGRSVPAVFDRTTGALRHFHINKGGKGNGGSFVVANAGSYFVHTRTRGVREFKLEKGEKTAFQIHEPVLTDDLIFSAELKDKKPVIRAYATQEVDKNTQKRIVWEIEADGRGDLILSGNSLFAAGEKFITPILLGDNKRATPKIGQPIPVEGDVLRLLTANQRLIAVTLDGRVDVFSNPRTAPNVLNKQRADIAINNDEIRKARTIIQQSQVSNGYMIWYEAADSALLAAVAAESEFQIDVVNENPSSVARLRRELDAAGLYGHRIRVHVGSPLDWMAPQYIASAIVVGSRTVGSIVDNRTYIQRAYDGLRPYGGRMLILHDSADTKVLARSVEKAALENVKITRMESAYLSGTIATRVGPLTGSGDWTHQYGDISNTVKSDDSRVKLPLGVLWFGGTSNMDVLPRHGHGPPEQVVNGRLYIQGMNSMNCRDVYTGRLLWKHEFDDLGTNGIYYDETYADTPLDLGYNQVHIPGANGRGTNFVATTDLIYVAVGSGCIVLDAVTGNVVRAIQLPADENGDRPDWGFIGVADDVLLAGNGFANYRARYKLSFEEDEKKLSKNAKGYGAKSFDVSASRGLVAFNRHTGKQLWSVPADHTFVHNAIVAGGGRVYCLDKQPEQIEEARVRRGMDPPRTYRIVSVDLKTGKVVWQIKDKIFGSWLSYSAKHDVLLQAGAAARDRMKSEVGSGMAVYNAANGKLKWIDEKRKYVGPCILHHDTILTSTDPYKVSAGAYSLLDGKAVLTTNPLTGKDQPWQVCRAYGCNSIIASENLLTFRSGAAGFYDLTTKSGTGNLGGFKSGCTANLVVANGVLNAPDYTRTCVCGYQNQTSLGLVHMPSLDVWTVNQESNTLKDGERISRIGVNFGAPGDRIDSKGTLWVDYPIVGGDSADLNIRIDGDHAWYRTSSTKFAGDGPAWVGSSGLMNAKRIWISLSAGVPKNQFVYKVLKAYDDAEEEGDSKVNLTSGDLEMTKTSKPNRLVGLRFNHIGIPQNTKIRSAYIQFTAAAKSSTNSRLKIHAIDKTDPGRFKNVIHGISSLELSKTSVEWKPANWLKAGDAGKAQRTPDLSQFIREHIQRKSWKPNGAIGFVISGTGERNAKSQKSAKDAPRLVINTDPGDEPRSFAKLPPASHTVRLYFAEPQSTKPGQRKFAVALQGESVIEELDIAASTGQIRSGLVKEFKGVEIADSLEIVLTPITGQPVISGVEIIRE